MTQRFRWALAAAYVFCTFLSFPHPVGDRVLDLGAGLAWLGPAFLLLAVRGLGPRRAWVWAFAAALVAHGALFHWIYVVTVVYGYAPIAVGLLAPLLLGAYVALFVAAFAASHAWLARWRLASPFAVAAVWTACEHARSFVLSGFPWATLGYAQHENTALLGLAAFLGVYGLSFVTLLGAAALADALLAIRRRVAPGPAVWVALGGVLGAHALGFAARAPVADAPHATFSVAVLQGNIDQGVKWSPEWASRTLDIYASLTRDATGRGARLVVWPETAVPGSLEWDAALRGRVESLARESGAALVVGGVGLEFGAGSRPSAYFDSGFVVGADGVLRDRYDKTHLVPFGEYVPLRSLLDAFFRALARGIAETGVTAGSAARTVEIPVPGARTLRAGVPICYELLFPDVVRRLAGDGAEVLLAITNDAWYGRTGAPHQFLAITALRAAETRLWVARAANTGVSAFIDPRGVVRAQTRIFERDLLVADLPLGAGPGGGSFYVRHGDLFAAACWIGALALAAAGVVRGRRAAAAVHERSG